MTNPTHPTRAISLLMAVAALVLFAAACGGGTDSADSDGAQNETPTTIGSSPTSSDTAVEDEIGDPIPEGPVAPFTGLPVNGEIGRPALAVKIDNLNAKARPQAGINQADVVFEIRVEGITRFMAVYHSTDADVVGPVRSARTSDINVLNMLSVPMFTNSGMNAGTRRLLNSQGNFIDANVDVYPAEFYRERSRPSTHNLMTGTAQLWSHVDETDDPEPLFAFRPRGGDLPGNAVEVAGVDIAYRGGGGARASYRWDQAVQGWARTQQDTPHVDEDDLQVAPANVVVMFVEYGVSQAASISPEAKTVGSGEAWVLTEGHLIEGTWERPSSTDLPTFTDTNGDEIQLTRGRTWIALPDPGTVTLVATDG
ncbi:MAG: DUF3048 domain-containing protein [Actinomycetia bacterium]|nr:DUF3048 domain-containing protein [Actinomycetes bacterium]